MATVHHHSPKSSILQNVERIFLSFLARHGAPDRSGSD